MSGLKETSENRSQKSCFPDKETKALRGSYVYGFYLTHCDSKALGSFTSWPVKSSGLLYRQTPIVFSITLALGLFNILDEVLQSGICTGCLCVQDALGS